MKKIIFILALLIPSFAGGADTILTITIPDANNIRVLNDINAAAGKPLFIQGDYGSGSIGISYAPKDVAETNKQFAQRVAKSVLIGLIRYAELKADTDRYRSQVSTITTPSVNVSTDTVQ